MLTAADDLLFGKSIASLSSSHIFTFLSRWYSWYFYAVFQQFLLNINSYVGLGFPWFRHLVNGHNLARTLSSVNTLNPCARTHTQAQLFFFLRKVRSESLITDLVTSEL